MDDKQPIEQEDKLVDEKPKLIYFAFRPDDNFDEVVAKIKQIAKENGYQSKNPKDND